MNNSSLPSINNQCPVIIHIKTRAIDRVNATTSDKV